MIPKKKPEEKFTYADYLSWPDEERWELIEGEAWDMSPAPGTDHQKVLREIFGRFYEYLQGKNCELFPAPFDVRFQEPNELSDEEILTVVQPDLVVICDPSKIDERGCAGAPDIAVEILSPSTAYKDETMKLKLYEKHGVKEYWIVNPEAQYIMIYRLDREKYSKPEYLKDDDIIESRVLKGFKAKLSDLFL